MNAKLKTRHSRQRKYSWFCSNWRDEQDVRFLITKHEIEIVNTGKKN